MMVRASLVSWKMQTLSSSLSFAVFETFSTKFVSNSKRKTKLDDAKLNIPSTIKHSNEYIVPWTQITTILIQ